MDINKLLIQWSKASGKDVYVSTFASPVGKVLSAADDSYLYFVTFEDSKDVQKRFETLSQELSCNFIQKTNNILQTLEEELESYFVGKLTKFTVPIKTIGTDFQKEVWSRLQELPYASTQTYGDLAKSMGRASSHARAIGSACGANAHLLVIPCHRLVASGGKKGGFSCGIDRKEWLLQHEQKYAP